MIVSQQTAPSSPRWLGWVWYFLLVLFAYSVWVAPIDRVQGIIQKILYVHPPLAFGAYLAFFITALAGATYLWRGQERMDRLSYAGAEVGVLFCTLVMITGPIWAKGTWGQFWSWDPRLIVSLLLWFVYVAYLLLRSLSDASERTARISAVYAIAGLFIIPLNYAAIDLFGGRAIHPENLKRGSLGEGMGLPFLLGTLTALWGVIHLTRSRLESLDLEHELETQQDPRSS